MNSHAFISFWADIVRLWAISLDSGKGDMHACQGISCQGISTSFAVGSFEVRSFGVFIDANSVFMWVCQLICNSCPEYGPPMGPTDMPLLYVVGMSEVELDPPRLVGADQELRIIAKYNATEQHTGKQGLGNIGP